MGCGDWQFSQAVNWGEAHYRGYDIVESVITANKEKYADEGIEFFLYSGEPTELPSADLLIMKDVLQHLSNKRVTEILSHAPRFKYVLITNSIHPDGETQNVDIPDGSWRYLDVRHPPFNVAADEVFYFHKKLRLEDGSWFLDPRVDKNVLLVRQRAPNP
jgi:hypothetical protein